jgi:hypothetical protein
MKELGLQELLRYALSGGIGIASLLLMYPKVACLIGHIEGTAGVTLILGAILVVGTLVYNIHRALLFPPIFRAIGLITLPWINPTWKLLILWLPSDAEIEFDRWRWKLEDKDRRRWDEWSAQTHSLYCAAWATLAAFVFGRYLAGPPSCQSRQIFWVLFCTTLIAGMVNNFRLLYSIAAEKSSSSLRS